MDYQAVTVWTVIKGFLISWAAAGAVLVVVSCMKYKEFIATVFANSVWAWINTIIPILIVIFAIRYIFGSLLK